MIKKPKVTLGVCVKNCEALIEKVIRSIINQDFKHELIEVIFVDDSSEDNTLSIILNMIPRIDMEVKVFRNNGEGIGSARNMVVKEASGDYIIWVDGDMMLSKDFVRKQVEFMDNNPKVGVAKGKYGILANMPTVAFLENIHFVVDNFKFEPGTGGSIYRAKAIRKIGGFDSNLRIAGEDQDAISKIRASGWLLSRSQAIFYEIPRKTWKDLWKKYLLWGYGLHDALYKNSSLLSLYKMTPIAGFLAGLIRSFTAYKIIRKKRVFLLPIHFVFKMSAWWYGYIKRHKQFYSYRFEPLKIKSKISTLFFSGSSDFEKKSRSMSVIEWKQRKLKLTDPWYQLILKMMKSTINNLEEKRILEVGCGLGGFCVYIASERGNAVGLDISKKAVQEAKVLSKKYNVKSLVDFIVADAQFLPFKEESFEAVFCCETLEHIENYKQAFHELVGVIKKNGYLLATVPNIFSMLLLEYLYFILIGQPKYVKEFLNVNREEIFHFFKLKRLLVNEELKLIEMRGTDFLHLHPKIKRIFPYIDIFSKILEINGQELKFFGAHIGVIAKKT
jgi:glycosyltransferase involved in cell wall biosynthesis